MTQQSSISKIECAPLGVLLRISAETAIRQSKKDTLCQRRKTADQAFVAFRRTMRCAAQGAAIVKEVKLRTRLLLQHPADRDGFRMCWPSCRPLERWLNSHCLLYILTN